MFCVISFCRGKSFWKNRSSTENHVSIIENSSLSRSNCSLWFLECDLEQIIIKLFYSCRLFRLTVACLDFAFDRLVQMIPWNQVNIVDVTAGAHQILFAAKDNLVGIQGFATYIEGFRCRNSKTAALTDGIVNLTFVFAEYVALFIYEIARFRRLSGILFNKGSIISVRYEADILTVRFPGQCDESLFWCSCQVETMYAPADPASWRREHSSDLLSDRGLFSE